jgi:hypothetical protein
MRAHAADMRRFIEETRQNVNRQIAGRNVIGLDTPATAQHNIPETVDGVETGFLNSRHITLEYLNRAEDLVENHPDVAAKVFDQGDSMHRFILTMVKNRDFDSGMETYKDATDRQYAAEGDKVAVSGMLSGLGNKYGMFNTSPDVTQFLMGNNYVNTMEKSVQDIATQQEKIAQLQASHNHAWQMANDAAYREASGVDMSPAQASQFAVAWQNEEALLRSRLDGAKNGMQDMLQDVKNLEARGISGDVTADFFTTLYAQRAGAHVNLKDLYKQYGVETAEPYIDHAANSGFARTMQTIVQNSLAIQERYAL